MAVRRRAAAIDPGSTRNSFALAVVGENSAGIWIPLALREWIPRPGKPLDLRIDVLPEAAEIVLSLGCNAWASDAFASAETRIVSAEKGLRLVFVDADAWEQWRHAFAVVNRGQISLAPTGRTGFPDAPALARARSQLATVRRAPAARGKWEVTLPEVEGAHGDLAVALARALWLAKAGDVVIEAPVDYYSGASEYAGEFSSLSDV